MKPPTTNVTRVAGVPTNGAELQAVASGVTAQASHDHSLVLTPPLSGRMTAVASVQATAGNAQRSPATPLPAAPRALPVFPLMDVVVSEKTL